MLGHIKAFFKFLFSFRKTKGSWDFEEYPIRVRINVKDPSSVEVETRLKTSKYLAQVVNWWTLSGMGNTPEEAISDLRKDFEKQKKEKGNLPRPGTKVPLVFAETTEIEQFDSLARDFFTKILNQNWDECFISDQSSIWDFDLANDTLDPYFKKIEEIYGIDVSEIKDGNFVKIFKKITLESGIWGRK